MKALVELAEVACSVLWRFPSAPLSRTPVVLLYHGVPRTSEPPYLDAAAFDQHVAFLKQHFAPVPVAAAGERSLKPRVILTFDDGFRNNCEVVAPILRRHGVPGCFFVCTRHSVPGATSGSAT